MARSASLSADVGQLPVEPLGDVDVLLDDLVDDVFGRADLVYAAHDLADGHTDELLVAGGRDAAHGVGPEDELQRHGEGGRCVGALPRLGPVRPELAGGRAG